MKHGLLFLFFLQAIILAAQTSPKPPGQWGDQGDGNFRNPILRADYSDPDPLRVGNNTGADEGIADFDYFKYQVNNR